MSLAVTRDPLIGRTLGDFIVREKIGEGGFGAVYRSEQPLLDREAVIKVLHRQELESEATVKRFLLEARLASRLDHPYAAHIYAFGVERDGLIWIAMELVRGTPLNHLLDAGGPLPLDRFVPLLERICEVVHSAHEKGIVHRDIKPGNVMVLTRSGRFLPKLLDFGIAKLLAHPGGTGAARTTGGAPLASGNVEPTAATIEVAAAIPSAESVTIIGQVGGEPSGGSALDSGLTEQGAVMGSPHYMAPEQWLDLASADARTDIYALGVLAYESLTGFPPFRGRTRLDLARAHAHDPVPSLGEGFPPALDAVLARAMAKDPAERFASALELGAAVRLASGLIDSSAPLPALEDPVREAALAGAPQPIAEAVAALAAARTPHEAQGAVRDCQHVVVRTLGLVALACRSRVGAGGGTTARDAPEVLEALRALRRRDLDDEEWRDLTRDLCRPFAATPDAHPMPEMVRLFTGEPDADLLAVPATAPRAMSAEQAHADLARSLPRLARLLRAVSFLDGYPLVVWRDGRAESWMGLRRTRRAAISAHGHPLPPDQPALLDRDGRPVVRLWPLFQVARPAPGADHELFLFVGKDRRGARFVALPGELERHDDSLWEWFGLHLIDSIEDTTGSGSREEAPYRGLLPFTAAEAADYVGREAEVDVFLNRLRVQPLLAVVAPSGVGKSSFVQAGVVPALGESWQVLIGRPGPAPRAALAALLERSGVEAAGAEAGAALRQHAAQSARPVLVVIDQFEELFTLCLDPEERVAYAEEIASLARSPDDRVRVVFTLRDDFLARADELPALRERLAVGLQLLSMPSRADLIRVLIDPARRHGYDFEDPELPARMVDEVAGRPGALALLSFTAARLWELRDRHFKQLGRKAYDALGGVAGALAQHAEATLGEMAADEQRQAREAFRHLVTAVGTRAVLTRAELTQLLGGSGRAERVIERLIGARLLVASETGEAGEQSIEVVHEALLSAWPRLVQWRREDAEGARLRDQLRAAARQWDERGRPRGLLWRDEAWAEYEIWRARFPGARTDVEEAFADASAAEAARGRRIRRALVLVAFAALAAFVLFLARANRETGRARERAEGLLIDSFVEQGRQALLGGEHARALAYLVEARRLGDDSPALSFLIRRALRPLEPRLFTLAGHLGKVWDVAFSPDGRVMVTTDDRDVHLWDAATGRELVRLSGHTNSVFHARFSPDGARLATGGADSTIRLWDARSGRALATLRGHRGRIESLVWAPDGARLLSAGQDGARLWDPAGARELAHIAGDPAGLRVAAIDPAGHFAALGSVGGQVDIVELGSRKVVATLRLGDSATALDFDGQARLLTASWSGLARVWRVPDGTPVFTLVGHGDKVNDAAFSPDHRWIVTAGHDGTARVWNAETGEMVSVLRGHRGPVQRARFDGSSERIVTTGGDGAAAVWERASGRRFALYEGHAEPVFDARFAFDGTRVATASWDGTAIVWSVADAYEEARTRAPGGACVFPGPSTRNSRYLTVPCAGGTAIWDTEAVAAVAELPGAELAEVSSDGERAITAAGSVATIWDLVHRRELGRIEHGARVAAVDWSPTARAAVSAGDDGVIRLWREGAAAVDLGGRGAPITAAAFTPDGRLVLSGDGKGALHLFDAVSGAPIATLAVHGGVEALRFSRDARLVVVLPPLGDAQPSLWDLARRARVAVLTGHTGALLDARFDRRGERLVTSSGDGIARLYNARTGAPIGDLTGGTQFITSAAFDDSGQLVAATGGDGAIRFWDVSSLEVLWVLDAGRVPGVELRFAATDRLVARDWEGAVHVFRIDRRPIGISDLDAIVRCRSPVRFDNTRRTLVGVHRPAACR